jgi:hypothetical protein
VFKSAANFETNPGKIFWQDQTYYFKDGGNFKAENQSPIYIGNSSSFTLSMPGPVNMPGL